MRITRNAIASSPAFWTTIGLFAAANLWSWLRHRFFPPCCDQEMTIGFPFPFHLSGGIAGTAEFFVLGLLLDIFTALTAALILTRLVRRDRDAS